MADRSSYANLADAVLRYLGIKNAKRLTTEQVVAVSADGTAQTSSGHSLRTSGDYVGLRAGQQVPILWSREVGNQRGGVAPAAILAHQARHGAVPYQPMRKTGAVVEELFVVDGAVWFRNWALFAEIIPRTSIPLDNPTHPFTALWGFGDRMFFLRVAPIFDDPRSDYYLIYALDRPEGGPSASAAPRAIFVRRVNRPQSLVVDTILGDPIPFNDVTWRMVPYLGSTGSRQPSAASMLWAGTYTYTEIATSTHHAIGYLVEDRGGEASVVWRAEDAMTDTFIWQPFGQDVGTAIRTPAYDIQVAFWDSDGDQRVAWVLSKHTTTIISIWVAPSGLFTLTTGERTESAITAGIDRIAGAALWRLAFTSSTTWTVPGPNESIHPVGEDILVSLTRGEVSLQVGEGDAVFYQTLTARSTARTYQISQPTAPPAVYPGSPSSSTLTAGLALVTAPISDVSGVLPYHPSETTSPPVIAADYELRFLTTHRTGLVLGMNPSPPGSNYQWAVIDLSRITAAILSGASPTMPLFPVPAPNDAQKKIAALITLPAAQDGIWTDIHVVYDVASLAAAGDA